MLAPIFVDIFIRMGANIALKWNLPKMKNGGLIKESPAVIKILGALRQLSNHLFVTIHMCFCALTA